MKIIICDFYHTCLCFLIIPLVVFVVSGCGAPSHSLTIHSSTVLDIELKGFDGLAEQTLFTGSLSSGKNTINIPYQGLALLIFSGGQSYPVIVDAKPFSLNIKDASVPPSFTDSGVNQYFYNLLSEIEHEADPVANDFAHLMIQAKQLLESSSTIRTLNELLAKKKEFHMFVSENYENLKHSDMVRRLIAQYFMMHEYVDYHVEGLPAGDIRVKYQQAVLDGVDSWIEILKPFIPEHEVLNYCVSLYYGRSMVSLASLITDKFRSVAFCPGVEKETWSFPDNLTVTDATKSTETHLCSFTGKKTVAFVSEDCPVSMVETVIKARQFAVQKTDERLVVAPLQELSENHLIMDKMVSGGNMLFINDEKWRKENLLDKITLPLFVEIDTAITNLNQSATSQN